MGNTYQDLVNRRTTLVALGGLLAGCAALPTSGTETSCPDVTDAPRSTCYEHTPPEAAVSLHPSPEATGQPTDKCVPTVTFTLRGNATTIAYAHEYVLYEHRDADWHVVRDSRDGERGDLVEPGHEWVLPIGQTNPGSPREDTAVPSLPSTVAATTRSPCWPDRTGNGSHVALASTSAADPWTANEERRTERNPPLYVRKDSPQPHSASTFGFSTWNPAACRPSS